MTTAAQPSTNGRHHGEIAGAPELLEALAHGAAHHVDRTATRRALVNAADAWPGAPEEHWWKWLLEAAANLQLRVRALDGTAAEALELVRFGGAVATWIPGGRGEWLLIQHAGPRKARLSRYGGHSEARSLKLKNVPRALDDAGLREPVRWVVVEPESACSEAGHHGDGHEDHLSPLARMWALLRPEWSDVWVVLVFALFIGLLALATPIAVESLVNTVAFGQFLQPVVVLSLILFAFLLFAAAMRAVQTYVVEIIQRRLFARVAGDLAWRLPRVHQDAWDREYGPELVNRFFDVITVQKTAASLLLDGVTLVLGTLIGMAVLAFYHPWLLGFDLFLLAMIAFTIFVLGRGAVASSIKESKAKYATAAWLQDLARCPASFKSAGAPELAIERADRLVADYLTARGKHFRVFMRQILFALLLQALASTVLLGLGGWLVVRGQLTLGQLVAAEMIVAVVVGAFAKMGKHIEAFYDLLTSVDKLGHLFDLPLERQEGLLRVAADGPAAVQLHRVSYHYPDEPALLRGLNLSIAPGERVGLAGPAGSGKSTLMDLLYGLRAADGGHVELDGTDLRDLRPDVLRRNVALARSVDIFRGTIEQNVHLERPGITTADVRAALERAGLLAEVLELPEGLNTELESTGAPLTRGQARRLVLARVLAGRPRLLLVDGLLDECGDEELATLLEALSPQKACTLVVASGRRRVLDWCDRVVTLEGSHKTTPASSGRGDH